jgi:MoaA/NifB/PqqE/SkfB family radical SAM enzyme
MAVTLLGAGPELHDRLAGRAGAFAEAERALPAAARVVVEARRANVFALAAIVELACRRRGGAAELPPLDPHPPATLAGRFAEHLARLADAGRPRGVEVVVADPLLAPLLAHVAARADGGNEVDLLRALGIVCDTALVGPQWFVFETVNRCNARCRYCNIHAPSRRPSREFLAGMLPFATFARTVDDLARMGTQGVTILANGEPTLHPDFPLMVQYAKQRGLRVNFFTNGLALDDDLSRLVVEAGVDEMFCTISAATPATYTALHADVDESDWDTLLANLRRLFARRAANGGKPAAWMVNVICNRNAVELPAMAALASGLGFDGLRPQLLRVDEHNRALALDAADLAQLRERAPALADYCRARGLALWEPYLLQLEHAGDRPEAWSSDVFIEKGCFIGFALGLAKANGDLSFCCDVKPVANLADGPFRELWAGGLYSQARLAAKQLRPGAGPRLRDGATLFTDACRHCDNHDINHGLHRLLDRFDMWRYLGCSAS